MRFKKILIQSHPRSGSHYFARLIDINFYNGGDYLQHYGSHVAPTSKYFNLCKTTGGFYLWRNTEDTIKSIYNMRHRFGLDEDDFNVFTKKTLSEMYTPNLLVNVAVNNVQKRRIDNTVNNMLSTYNVTAEQYILEHKKQWFEYCDSHSNIMVICYDELKNDFNHTMSDVAKFIGSSKNTNFLNDREKIGWVPI